MQNSGLYAFLGIVGFALVFAFWPSGTGRGADTGAQLSGVQLRLYPAQDPDAVWSFRAANVRVDPVANETRLDTLSGGERRIGLRTGNLRLDARMTAPGLTIDGQDNLVTPSARITLVKECADIALKSNAREQVKIEQGTGFSAPQAKITSPFISGTAINLKMTFNFDFLDMDNDRSSTEINTSPRQICENGRLVPNPKWKPDPKAATPKES